MQIEAEIAVCYTCPVSPGVKVNPFNSAFQMIGLYKARNIDESELTSNFYSVNKPSAATTNDSAEVVVKLHQKVHELEDKLALYEVCVRGWRWRWVWVWVGWGSTWVDVVVWLCVCVCVCVCVCACVHACVCACVRGVCM